MASQMTVEWENLGITNLLEFKNRGHGGFIVMTHGCGVDNLLICYAWGSMESGRMLYEEAGCISWRKTKLGGEHFVSDSLSSGLQALRDDVNAVLGGIQARTWDTW